MDYKVDRSLKTNKKGKQGSKDSSFSMKKVKDRVAGSRESEAKEGTLVFHFLSRYDLIWSVGQPQEPKKKKKKRR